MDLEERKQKLAEVYLSILEEKKTFPSYSDFITHGISRDVIRSSFGGIGNFHTYMKENFHNKLSSNLSLVEDVFSEDRGVHKSESVKFIITTAVADSKADTNFLSALDVYCNKNNAQIVIMPCESITNSFENETAVFDSIFNDKKYMFVQKDTKLNENISLCSIQVSAKQIKPITGLQRLGNREGSYVFASPKQFLEYIPSGNTRNKNFTIMTPGACTLPDYHNNRFVSKRLSYIADFDHTIGAIVVEIIDDQLFDFRQVQADKDGSFIDMGIQYNADGSTKLVPGNVVFGDIHGIKTNHQALNYFCRLFSSLVSIQSVFIHDIFDGYSISHHIRDIYGKSTRANAQEQSLQKELIHTYGILDYINSTLKPSSVNIVKSNHDEFLDRYLSEGRYINDPENHYFALQIATALFEDKDVLQYALEKAFGEKLKDNIHFLSREDSVQICGVECAAHGDLGLNGAKASLNSAEKIYGNCVIGHSHSPAIQRGVFRVGTLSKLFLDYNRGPSSWAHTCCIIYENGQRQLINYIEDFDT